LSPTWAKDAVLRTRDLVSGGEFTSARLGVHGKARHFFNLISSTFYFSLIFLSAAINSPSLFSYSVTLRK